VWSNLGFQRSPIQTFHFIVVKDIVRPGETISAYSISRKAGGKGANQAVAVAKAGGNVTLVGAIGEDASWVKDQLVNFGVYVGDIKIVEVSYTVPS
jgi:ribokinase